MKVIIKFFGWKEVTFEEDFGNMTLSDFKTFINKTEYVPIENIRLVFQNEELTSKYNEKSLTSIGIKDGSKVYLHFVTDATHNYNFDEDYGKKSKYEIRLEWVKTYYKAVTDSRAKQYEKSYLKFKQNLKLSSNKVLQFYSTFSLGEAFEDQCKFKNASTCYYKCMEILPEDYEPIYRIGKIAQKKGDLRSAKLNFLKAIQKHGISDPRPYYELSRIYRDIEEDLKKSKMFLEKAHSISPDLLFVVCDKILLKSLLNEEFEDGVFELDDVITKNLERKTYYSYPYYIKSILQQEMEQFDVAIETVTKALSMKNFEFCEEQMLLCKRANFKCMLQKHEDAISDFMDALKLGESTVSDFNYNNLALSYFELEEYEKAVKYFQKAVVFCKSKQTGTYFENMGNAYLNIEGKEDLAVCMYLKSILVSGLEHFGSDENLERGNELLQEKHDGLNVLLYFLKKFQVKENSLKIVKFFSDENVFQEPVDIKSKDNFQRSCLHFYCENNFPIERKVLDYLFEHCDFRDRCIEGRTIVHYFVRKRSVEDNLDILKYFIEELEFDINSKDNKNKNFLHSLFEGMKDKTKKDDKEPKKLMEVVKYLVEKGIKLNDLDTSGRNPLHYYCMIKNILKGDVGEYLISKGSKHSKEDVDGKKPTDYLVNEDVKKRFEGL